jgi:excisionase family DNA binding protein
MAKDSKRCTAKPQETGTLLKSELRRRGLTDAEIDAKLRKKKRRKALEFGIVKLRHAVPAEKISPPAKPSPSAPRHRLADDLCTVEFAAERLKVHQKTILRFVRKGRLKATRIGKSYRILRSDLEDFAGVKLPAEVAAASMTSIVDLPGIASDRAQKLSLAITSALQARANRTPPLRADIVYEPERSNLKVIVVGAPVDALNLLGLIRIWIES